MNDNQFLQHLEKLEQTKLDTEKETERLILYRARLKKNIEEMETERDIAARIGLSLQSEQSSLEAKKYEMVTRRRFLESHLNSILLEEFKTRSITEHYEKNFQLVQDLNSTKNQLLEAIKTFDLQYNDNNIAQQGPNRFEVDRLRRIIDGQKRDLESMRIRLATALQNEENLKKKHQIEKEKNNESGIC